MYNNFKLKYTLIAIVAILTINNIKNNSEVSILKETKSAIISLIMGQNTLGPG